MSGNSIGTLFKLTTFGESHGPAIGGIIDGCPAGLLLEVSMVQDALDRRKPGQSKITTQRKEADRVEFLSGIFEGRTTGTPIGFKIENADARGRDYDHLKAAYRPSHADYTYDAKYGIRDHRGGGRSSARETACRVVAGAVAAQILALEGISTIAWVNRVQDIIVETPYTELNLTSIENNPVRCPDPKAASAMEQLIAETKKNGNTVGGAIQCVSSGVPAGWGEPVFDKLHAELAKAIMGINATRYFSLGSGVAGTFMTGTEHNDLFDVEDGQVVTKTNYSGGIQGGISNGADIVFEVGFKPVATVLQKQATVNKAGENVDLEGRGRHDPCVLPRAVPIVEAMTNLVLVDAMLRARSNRL